MYPINGFVVRECQVVLAHIHLGRRAHLSPRHCRNKQNVYIERFNRIFREDTLNAYLISSVNKVPEIAEKCRLLPLMQFLPNLEQPQRKR